ncbi:hypothetical protein GCM10009608_20100 [Pseudonocardia alaniniphila]
MARHQTTGERARHDEHQMAQTGGRGSRGQCETGPDPDEHEDGERQRRRHPPRPLRQHPADDNARHTGSGQPERRAARASTRPATIIHSPAGSTEMYCTGRS